MVSPYPQWRQGGQGMEVSAGGLMYDRTAASPAPQLNATEGAMHEDDLMDNEDFGSLWQGVLDLYTSSEPRNPSALMDFVLCALQDHLQSFDNLHDTLPQSIARTFLLIHILFYDCAYPSRPWPMSNDTDATMTGRIASWLDLEERLRPPDVESGDAEGGLASPFDPCLCHLRRVIFWLEFADLGDPGVDTHLKQLYEGMLTTMDRDDGDSDISFKGSLDPAASIDTMQLIWLHVRRGELAAAQSRCRSGAGDTHEGTAGAKQWWRAAVLDPSKHCFESTQKAAMAGSRYSEAYDAKGQGYVDMHGPRPLPQGGSGERVSMAVWERHRSLCALKCDKLAEEESRVWMSVGGGGIRDVGSLKMHACERAVYAVLAGKPIRDESGGGGGEGERGGGGGREVMRAADVLRKWEDELWFEARGIFTREVSSRFSGRAPSDVTYMLRQALRSAGDSINDYGASDLDTAAEFCEIQRHIIGLEIAPLVELLRRRSLASNKDITRLAIYAQIVIFFKVILFQHAGAVVSGPVEPGADSADRLRDVLIGIEEVIRAFAQRLIQERHWDDIPYIIRLVQNHLIAHPEGEGFNAVISELARDNARLVDELCVGFLQGIESHEADSNERRRLLGMLEVIMGSEQLKRTSEAVVSRLEPSNVISIGERLHEIFEHTGQWDQAIHQAHDFLRRFHSSDPPQYLELGSVVDKLHELLASKEAEALPSPMSSIYAKEDFYHAHQAVYVALGGTANESITRTLTSVMHCKAEGDAHLRTYCKQRWAWLCADAAGRRDMMASADGTRGLYFSMECCLPSCEGEGGAVRKDMLQENSLARAVAAYLAASAQTRELADRYPHARNELLRLAFYVQQLSRLCVWSAIADIHDPQSGSFRFWRDSVSAVSSLSRQDEPEVRRVVKIGAIRHLYCLLQLMCLRPLWIAQDQVDAAPRGSSFGEMMSRVTDGLITGPFGYTTCCWEARNIMAGLFGEGPAREWHALSVGLASVVADEDIGIYNDVSEDCLESMLKDTWACDSLYLWCR